MTRRHSRWLLGLTAVASISFIAAARVWLTGVVAPSTAAVVGAAIITVVAVAVGAATRYGAAHGPYELDRRKSATISPIQLRQMLLHHPVRPSR